MVAVKGLSDETVALSMWSFAEYNRFWITVIIAGAGTERVPAMIVEKTDRLSAFIGNNISLPIRCCIILKLLK
jgi:hypothetical protein